MNKLFFKIATAAAFMLIVNSASANDCGWSQLTKQEQATVTAGQITQRHYMDADGARSHIDQWAFGRNSSLIESLANFYDLSEHNNIGGVADISLADGEVASNNPVIYNVVPKANNPFGQLYQPFSFEAKVKTDAEAYKVLVNYLSSPGLIKHVYNDVCLVEVDGKVLINLNSTVTDNPALPITGPHFGWDKRLMLWYKVFSDDVTRASQAGNTEKIENIKKALADVQ